MIKKKPIEKFDLDMKISLKLNGDFELLHLFAYKKHQLKEKNFQGNNDFVVRP